MDAAHTLPIYRAIELPDSTRLPGPQGNWLIGG
jgi:hypothetical protein